MQSTPAGTDKSHTEKMIPSWSTANAQAEPVDAAG